MKWRLKVGATLNVMPGKNIAARRFQEACSSIEGRRAAESRGIEWRGYSTGVCRHQRAALARNKIGVLSGALPVGMAEAGAWRSMACPEHADLSERQ